MDDMIYDDDLERCYYCDEHGKDVMMPVGGRCPCCGLSADSPGDEVGARGCG
jgi:hypothetical protein